MSFLLGLLWLCSTIRCPLPYPGWVRSVEKRVLPGRKLRFSDPLLCVEEPLPLSPLPLPLNSFPRFPELIFLNANLVNNTGLDSPLVSKATIFLVNCSENTEKQENFSIILQPATISATLHINTPTEQKPVGYLFEDINFRIQIKICNCLDGCYVWVEVHCSTSICKTNG